MVILEEWMIFIIKAQMLMCAKSIFHNFTFTVLPFLVLVRFGKIKSLSNISISNKISSNSWIKYSSLKEKWHENLDPVRLWSIEWILGSLVFVSRIIWKWPGLILIGAPSKCMQLEPMVVECWLLPLHNMVFIRHFNISVPLSRPIYYDPVRRE